MDENQNVSELQNPLLDTEEMGNGDDDGIVSPSPDSKGRKIPWSIRRELKSIIGISLPISVATIARLAIAFTDTAFVGHLGTVCLSASSLAMNWAGVLNDLMWTAGYALNSLGAQAIGAKNYRLAGEWLQLASVAVVLLCLLCIVGYFFTDDIIGLVSNDTAVVERSLEFNVFATLYLIPTAIYMTIRQFFQAMRIVVPATIVSIISIAFNIGMNQLLVHGFVTDSWLNMTSDSASRAANRTHDEEALFEQTMSTRVGFSVSSSAFEGTRFPAAGRMANWMFLSSTTHASNTLLQSDPVSQHGALGFSDPNRTWPWPAGEHSFPIAYENGTFAGFGFPGSPLATTASMLFQLLCFCIFCFGIKKYHAKYWGGWRCRSFSANRIRKYLKVVIPMTIGNCVEDWGYQVLAYLSGSLNPSDVAAISIMFSTWGIFWAFYWGWGLALQVRVGFHLGNGKIDRAKAAAKLSFFIVLTLMGSLSVTCYFLREYLPQIFTSDPVVIATAADANFLLCLSFFIGCTSLCGCSILEGMSRNTSMAAVQGIGTWFVHVPLTVYLMLFCPAFKTKPVRAFWLGSTLAETAKGAVMWTLVLTSNWEKQMALAKERNEAEVLSPGPKPDGEVEPQEAAQEDKGLTEDEASRYRIKQAPVDKEVPSDASFV